MPDDLEAKEPAKFSRSQYIQIGGVWLLGLATGFLLAKRLLVPPCAKDETVVEAVAKASAAMDGKGPRVVPPVNVPND